MTLEDQIKKAQDAMEAARKKLNTQNAQGAENAYALAYQQLVALGAAPQLRRKYR